MTQEKPVVLARHVSLDHITWGFLREAREVTSWNKTWRIWNGFSYKVQLLSFASPSPSQLFLQRSPFRHTWIDVARKADLAACMGCKEYCTPSRKIKPCQARNSKLMPSTVALLWVLHSLLWWDGRNGERAWGGILQAVPDRTLLWHSIAAHTWLWCSSSYTSCTKSGRATAAVRCPGHCGRRSHAPSAALNWGRTNSDTSATGRSQELILGGFCNTQIWLQTVQLLN